MVIPKAPQIPITSRNGSIFSSWFDLKIPTSQLRIHPLQFHDDKLIKDSEKYIGEIIEKECKLVPSDMVMIGGFGIGGALAISSGLKSGKRLGGIISVNGFTLE